MVATTIFRLCFILLFVPVVALCIWLPIISMAIGSAIPWTIIFWLILLCAEIASLVVYFRWPWIAALVSWLDMAMILSGLIPWKEHSLHSFLHQFGFDLMFFGLANLGFIASRFRKSPRCPIQARC